MIIIIQNTIIRIVITILSQFGCRLKINTSSKSQGIQNITKLWCIRITITKITKIRCLSLPIKS